MTIPRLRFKINPNGPSTRSLRSLAQGYSRTVWHIPIVFAIPLLRWSAGPFITAPIPYPNMDHEALLRPRLRLIGDLRKAVHPLRQAIKWQAMLDKDASLTQSQLAEKQGVSRARVCQVMRLLSLPKEVQSELLKLKNAADIRLLSERRIRDIALLPDEQSQLKAFTELRQKLRSAAIP